MNTAHFDFENLDKKQIKGLMGFLTKVKRIYKEGFYIINCKYLYPDSLSVAGLLGKYTLILSDKITNLLKLIKLPHVVFIKDAAKLTTKITNIEAEIPEDIEESEWLKGYYDYMADIDTYKKKGIYLESAEVLIGDDEKNDWLDRYIEQRRTLLFERDDIRFYHSSRMFPFLSVKNFGTLYFSASNRDDNYTGEMYFEHTIDEFEMQAHFYFLRLK